jgi:hypothetical protein
VVTTATLLLPALAGLLLLLLPTLTLAALARLVLLLVSR